MTEVKKTDGWQERGVALAQEHRLRQFAIADWLVEGIDLNGATVTYDAAETLFPQYHRATFLSWVTVARHFAPSIRIESEFLTFGHYQVAQGAADTPWQTDKSADDRKALELVWLKQADESRLSVSGLRAAIQNAFELRQRALLAERTEPATAELEPETEQKPTPPKKKVEQAFSSPWLPDKSRLLLYELARVRKVPPQELVARAVQDFIDAHTDEIGDAAVAEAKRLDEYKASVAAARIVEQERRKIAEQAFEQKRIEEFLTDAITKDVNEQSRAEIDTLEKVTA